MRQPPSVFYQPADGWVGDVIPFAHEDGTIWLFYLHERRDGGGTGVPWSLVTTKDFVQFDDRGVALRNGSASAPDFNAYTGSVVSTDDGVRHLFYTAQNPSVVGSDGLPLQLVMHAVSTDGMESWVKQPELTFGAPAGYESADWRDPFVFRDPRDGVWRMLIAARHVDGPTRRRGVIAQCVSSDLIRWEPVEPFWDPRRYIAHECPEVFAWGSWWYLVYSEFSDSFRTRYRMARTLDGPWMVPDHDSVDGRAFYASKTVGQDERRYFCGWIASREGNRDDGAWQWAGTMSAVEARQNADGTLAFSIPSEIIDSFTETVPFGTGSLPAALDVADGYASLISHAPVPSQVYVRVVFDIEIGTSECGLLLRTSADGDASYVLRLEPRRDRLVFDRWPRAVVGDGQWQVSGDVPYAVELERPCDLSPGLHTLEVITDGDLCLATVDQQVVLSTRLYDRVNGHLGAFVGEGCVTIHELEIRHRPDETHAGGRQENDT